MELITLLLLLPVSTLTSPTIRSTSSNFLEKEIENQKLLSMLINTEDLDSTWESLHATWSLKKSISDVVSAIKNNPVSPDNGKDIVFGILSGIRKAAAEDFFVTKEEADAYKADIEDEISKGTAGTKVESVKEYSKGFWQSVKDFFTGKEDDEEENENGENEENPNGENEVDLNEEDDDDENEEDNLSLWCTLLWYPYEDEKCNQTVAQTRFWFGTDATNMTTPTNMTTADDEEDNFSLWCTLLWYPYQDEKCNQTKVQTRFWFGNFGTDATNMTNASDEEENEEENENMTTPTNMTTADDEEDNFSLWCALLWYPYEDEKCTKTSTSCLACTPFLEAASQVCSRGEKLIGKGELRECLVGKIGLLENREDREDWEYCEDWEDCEYWDDWVVGKNGLCGQCVLDYMK